MKVAILVYPGVSLFELGCAVELFALPRPEFANWYQAQTVTLDGSKLASSANIALQCELVTNFDGFDMLVISSWPTNSEPVSDHLRQALLKFWQAGGRVLSFCSGAFLLAELGLLKGRKAITHWRYAEVFKSKYPEIEYLDDVLYCYDGQIGCSAGSSAGLDLGIEVIRQDFGHAAANSVARRLVMAAHRNGGQSQFIEKPVAKRINHFSNSLDWAVQNLSPKLKVEDLANRANMSRRTFDRHFRQQLGVSPKQWLIDRRLEIAKQLLETSQDNIELVAQQAGFDNAISLRHHFQKRLSLSPSRYREQFSD